MSIQTTETCRWVEVEQQELKCICDDAILAICRELACMGVSYRYGHIYVFRSILNESKTAAMVIKLSWCSINDIIVVASALPSPTHS